MEIKTEENTGPDPETVCVDLIILGDIPVARRCAELFDLVYDDVIERNSERITFEKLKQK